MTQRLNDAIDLSSAGMALLRAVEADLELLRRFRLLVCIGSAGQVINRNDQSPINFRGRQSDRGWADVVETTWAIACMDVTGAWEAHPIEQRQESLLWLKKERSANGAWGRTSRDMPRIPVTGWILTLLPELADEKSMSWLESEWKKDLNSETKLTYKGALTLMAFAATKANPKDASLIPETVEYLMSEQNEDGGYAPWKGHPVGSEPWSTGIDLLGLTAFPDLVRPEVVENTLDWLGRNQLPNGLWPCHYIEEGSAYCFWGAVEGMKYLKRIGRL